MSKVAAQGPEAAKRTDWAEDEDEDLATALPAPQVTKNKDGTETITTYFIREDGKKVKRTQRIRKTVIKEKVNPRVAERKTWTKFGAEKSKPAGPQSDTTTVAENIIFRPMAGWKASGAEKAAAEDKKTDQLKNVKIKCRICSGDHFTTKCPFKDTMAPEGEPGAGAVDLDVDAGADTAGTLGAGGSSYVPPHLRKGGAGTGERMGGKYGEKDDLATLRVTNVSEMAEEQDLREMFERFGRVTRVFLAKDRETGRAKGFAFVSYQERSEAAKACEKMDGSSADSGTTLAGPARHDKLAAGPEAFFKQTSRASPNASDSSGPNLPSERDFAHPENNNRPPAPQHGKRYRIRWVADFRRRHAAGHAGRKLAKTPPGDVVAASSDSSRESIPEDAPRPTDHVFAHLEHGEEPAAEGQVPASRRVRRWLEDHFLQW
ncbi:Eukaryotic translation initiation factor 3 subunit G [Cryomyces minteri]|uniref:Eukaryotic translation initiation factor 3 subunit G n=2 Tax=Cryomyces minteri TaxID=331657 RepID=A0A4U0X710_9PEZI|nr:Eukaryotic translation initiation factor 3 subunit G [Cryomyces minteri]